MTRSGTPQAAGPKQFRLPLSGKFAIAFVGLVTLVLLINGAVDLFLDFEDTKAGAIAVLRAGSFRGRPLGDLILRGNQEALRAFEPMTEAGYDDTALSQYRDAFAKLEGGEAGALPAFAALVGLRPNDGVAAFHLKCLLNGSSGTRIEVR